MKTIHICGAKGGVGASTVACLLATQANRGGATVKLEGAEGDHAAILGHLPADGVLPFGNQDGDGPLVRIVDHGTDVLQSDEVAVGDITYTVVRNDYLSLRAALKRPRADGVILVTEPGRALGRRDVEEVLGLPIVAELEVTQHTARLIDAGLLGRRPSSWTKALDILGPKVAS